MRATCGAALFALAAALVGCGGDPVGEVSGTVTYGGEPVRDGAITFFPDAGPTAGGVIKDGRYAATVAVGPARVKVSAARVVGQKKVYDRPDSPVRPVTAEALPAKYNTATELRYEVAPGTQTKDFDLAK